jgi:Sec-independent protein translocase protein TatA
MTAATPDIEHAREHLENAATGLMEAALAEPGDDALVWTAKLEKAARSLERGMREHKDAAEADDGPLAEIVAEKPTLSEEVEAQRQEHTDLLHRSERLATDCEKAISFQDPNEELLRLDGQILALMARRHVAWEAVMYYEAFFREEGGEEG